MYVIYTLPIQISLNEGSLLNVGNLIFGSEDMSNFSSPLTFSQMYFERNKFVEYLSLLYTFQVPGHSRRANLRELEDNVEFNTVQTRAVVNNNQNL